jgi:hypothetical protein
MAKITRFDFDLNLQKAFEGDGGQLRFRAEAATGDIDRDNEYFTAAALQELANPPQTPLVYLAGDHKSRPEKAVGEVDLLKVEGGKLIAEGYFYPWVSEAATAWHHMKDNVRSYAASVGGGFNYGPKTWDARSGKSIAPIVAAGLDHIVFCRPQEARNPMTLVQALEKARAEDEETEQMGKALLPLAVENLGWDAERAIAAVKDWAVDVDGAIDLLKYGQAFFYQVEDAAVKEGDFKLPFATVIDGSLHAVWNGIHEALSRLGSTDIPETDRQAVKSKIKSYYEAFDKDWPGDKDQTTTGGKALLAESSPIGGHIMADETPSISFSENLQEEQAEQAVQELVWEVLSPLHEALRETIQAIVQQPAEQQASLLRAACAEYSVAVQNAVAGPEALAKSSEAFLAAQATDPEGGKAGASISAANRTHLHAAIGHLTDACGCGQCGKCTEIMHGPEEGSDGKAGGEPAANTEAAQAAAQGETNMSTETDKIVEGGKAGIVDTTVAGAPATEDAQADPNPATQAAIQAAVDAALAPYKALADKVEELGKANAELTAKLETTEAGKAAAETEAAALAAAPAATPGAVSTAALDTDPGAPVTLQEVMHKAADEHDKTTYFGAHAQGLALHETVVYEGWGDNPPVKVAAEG